MLPILIVNQHQKLVESCLKRNDALHQSWVPKYLYLQVIFHVLILVRQYFFKFINITNYTEKGKTGSCNQV